MAQTFCIPVPAPVVMLDPPIHTASNGYRCNDSTCPCSDCGCRLTQPACETGTLLYSRLLLAHQEISHPDFLVLSLSERDALLAQQDTLVTSYLAHVKESGR